MYYEELDNIFGALKHDKEMQSVVGDLIGLTEGIYEILLNHSLEDSEKTLIIKRRLAYDIEHFMDSNCIKHCEVDWEEKHYSD